MELFQDEYTTTMPLRLLAYLFQTKTPIVSMSIVPNRKSQSGSLLAVRYPRDIDVRDNENLFQICQQELFKLSKCQKGKE